MQQILRFSAVFPTLCQRCLVNTFGSDLLSVYEKKCVYQFMRNSMIFRRVYPMRQFKPHQKGPFQPKLEFLENVIDMVENTDTLPAGDMQVILAADVRGLGLKGDVVTVNKHICRTHMLSVGVAEYLTPENLAKYEQIRKERTNEKRQSVTALKTLSQLSTMTLPIPMSSTVAWQLNKTHVKVAFRLAGVELNEDCITLPEEPVTEHKTVTLRITINGIDTVDVKALIYPYSKTVAPSLPAVWGEDSDQTKFDLTREIAVAAREMRRGLDLKPATTAAVTAAS